MIDHRIKLREITPLVHSLKDIGVNKKLAKFGDTITNLIYSIGKSLVIKQLDQRKVNRTILSNALKQAGMKEYCKNRANAHDMANTAEAFIGYVYCAENWSIDQMVDILVSILDTYDLSLYPEENLGATAAFSVLLTKIKEALLSKFSI